jgi:nitrile hydratase accessory protein
MTALDPSAADPTFSEPWEAQAFAMTVGLHERGLFSWSQWTVALGAEIARSSNAVGYDGHYYRHWLAVLEQLVVTSNIADRQTLTRYREAWRRAAARTPHGTAIELQAADFSVVDSVPRVDDTRA